MKNQICPAQTQNEHKMNSIHISKISGKNHRDVMRAIRNMEPAWEKINGRNFALVEYIDQKGQKRPMYELDWKECMFIGSKFNDEARARIIIEWAELREKELNRKQLVEKTGYTENKIFPAKLGTLIINGYYTGGQLWYALGTIMRFMGYDSGGKHYALKFGENNSMFIENCWYVNMNWIDEFIKNPKIRTSHEKIATLYKDLFRVDLTPQNKIPFTYLFTDSEILSIINEINSFKQKPAKTQSIIEKIMNGGGR